MKHARTKGTPPRGNQEPPAERDSEHESPGAQQLTGATTRAASTNVLKPSDETITFRTNSHRIERCAQTGFRPFSRGLQPR